MVRRTKKRKININGLTATEADIMQIVWRSGKVTVRDVHEELLKDGYLPYTTVMAAMNNLAQKGILKQNRDRKAYVYVAAINNEDAANEIVDHVVEKILDGSAIPVLCHLLKIKDKARVEELIKLRDSLDS